MSDQLQATAEKVFRVDLYDAAVGRADTVAAAAVAYEVMRDSIGTFIDANFDAGDIAGYLASWQGKRSKPRLSVVR